MTARRTEAAAADGLVDCWPLVNVTCDADPDKMQSNHYA